MCVSRTDALLRAFGESLFNVVDVATLGAGSDIRYGAAEGDWLRVALGVAEFIPLGKLAARGGSLIRRFGGEGLESAIRWGRGYVDEAVQAGRRYWDEFASGFRRGCSFSADTEVLTPDGLKPISEIQIGDAILGYNESNGEVDVFVVTATYTQHHETTLDLTIDGEVIHTTDEHPFYVKEQGWTEAGQLKIGDEVLRADGSYGVVEVMTVIDEPQTMYNLTVALAHTFVVGDNGWVVHNIDISRIGPVPPYQGGPRSVMQQARKAYVNHLVETAAQIQRVNVWNYVDEVVYAAGQDYPAFDAWTGWRIIEIDPVTIRKAAHNQLLSASHEILHAVFFDRIVQNEFGGNIVAAWMHSLETRPFGSQLYAIEEVVVESIARRRLEQTIGTLSPQSLRASQEYVEGWRGAAKSPVCRL